MAELTDDAKEARTARLDAAADAQAKAALDPKATLPPGHVRVRITKAGDGKVSTGASPRREHRDTGSTIFIGEQLDPRFKHNDTPILPRHTAEALEKRYFAEIID